MMITIEHDDFPSQNGELENIASLYKILENVSFKSLLIFIFVAAASPSTSSVRRGPTPNDDHNLSLKIIIVDFPTGSLWESLLEICHVLQGNTSVPNYDGNIFQVKMER